MWMINNLELIFYEIIAGAGAGLAMPIFIITAQNAVSKRDLGVATASNMYFEQLGSVIGLAVLGTVVNMTLNFNLQNTAVQVSSSLLVTAIHNVFITAVILNLIGLVLCFFLKDLYMSNEMEGEDIG